LRGRSGAIWLTAAGQVRRQGVVAEAPQHRGASLSGGSAVSVELPRRAPAGSRLRRSRGPCPTPSGSRQTPFGCRMDPKVRNVAHHRTAVTEACRGFCSRRVQGSWYLRVMASGEEKRGGRTLIVETRRTAGRRRGSQTLVRLTSIWRTTGSRSLAVQRGRPTRVGRPYCWGSAAAPIQSLTAGRLADVKYMREASGTAGCRTHFAGSWSRCSARLTCRAKGGLGRAG
jgi:hypothetical protein